MTRSGLRCAALALSAALLTAGCTGGSGDAAVQARDGGPIGESSSTEPPAASPMPDRANSRSTHHPDPCGVENRRDLIPREGGFWEGPADRVQAKAKKLFGDRFLGVFIANVEQQYGVGVGIHRLTAADVEAFFDAACFRVGDVVFKDAPVSRTQLRGWIREVERIAVKVPDPDGCMILSNWQTGMVEVGLKRGDPDVRRALEAAIPAEHLTLSQGKCPVPLTDSVRR